MNRRSQLRYARIHEARASTIVVARTATERCSAEAACTRRKTAATAAATSTKTAARTKSSAAASMAGRPRNRAERKQREAN